jgi:hypothetical protein
MEEVSATPHQDDPSDTGDGRQNASSLSSVSLAKDVPPSLPKCSYPKCHSATGPWRKHLPTGTFVVNILTLVALIVYVCATIKTNHLTAESLRLQHGARVRVNEKMGWYCLGDGCSKETDNRAYAVIQVQNDGGIFAENVEISAEMQFRESPPPTTAYSFSPTEYQSLDALSSKTLLHDHPTWHRIIVANNEDYPKYRAGNAKLYVWGTIRFTDSLIDPPRPVAFCRVLVAAPKDQVDFRW